MALTVHCSKEQLNEVLDTLKPASMPTKEKVIVEDIKDAAGVGDSDGEDGKVFAMEL